MSESILPPEILSLPVSTRLVMVEELWDSIAHDDESVALTDAQKAELDSRLELQRRDPDRGSPWVEVKKRLLDSL